MDEWIEVWVVGWVVMNVVSVLERVVGQPSSRTCPVRAKTRGVRTVGEYDDSGEW